MNWFSLRTRKVILCLMDCLVLGLSMGVTSFFLSGFMLPRFTLMEGAPVLTAYLLCNVAGLAFFGSYRNMWRYAGLRDFCYSVFGVVLGNVIFVLSFWIIGHSFPLAFYVGTFAISMCAIIGMRLLYKYIYDLVREYASKQTQKRVMVVGAGVTGKLLLQELTAPGSIYNPVCLVDDDVSKITRSINGVTVLGSTEKIPEICKEQGIKLIFFAISSCSESDKRRILQACSDTHLQIKIIPRLSEINAGQGLLPQAAAFKIEDLLGRDPVTFDSENVRNFLRGKVCLITGGGGSIGSELCRQIMQYDPKELIIFDIYENNAYEIQQELVRHYNGAPQVHTIIGSVRDFYKLDDVFKQYRPQIVFHAAAHKHVPLMETTPEEAVKNNIFGTFNTAMLADLYRVEKMVLVSTDKAVNPTNVMGATKRCCEMIMQYMSQQTTGTEFAAVRFGNVLGSNGSVIPLFEKQIKAGGPVTVTHPDIIRYFMTIPEAVSLVLQAGAMAHGGEIFVLDMGDPVKITTLAENLIRLHGMEPYTEMKIEFTGLRPGEKLFEELLMDEEGLQSTENHKIFIGNQIKIDMDDFIQKLQEGKEIALQNDRQGVIEWLRQTVPTFRHTVTEGPNGEEVSQTEPAEPATTQEKVMAGVHS